MKADNILKNVKTGVLNQILEDLKNIKDKDEVYFHDIISSIIDRNTPQTRKECLSLIDKAETEYFDSDLIDKSNINRMFITMAYCSIEQILFNDDFIQELQTDLNNEEINKTRAKEIIIKIENHLKQENLKNEFYEDYENQIFINVNFKINIDDFKPFIEKGFLNEKQLIDLYNNNIKILTSNKKLLQNALIIENVKKGLLRVYLQCKDKDIDIRNFFKFSCISEKTGFNLSPSRYIKQSTEQYENDKKNIMTRKSYLSEFNNKEDFLKHIMSISQELTNLTI